MARGTTSNDEPRVVVSAGQPLHLSSLCLKACLVALAVILPAERLPIFNFASGVGIVSVIMLVLLVSTWTSGRLRLARPPAMPLILAGSFMSAAILGIILAGTEDTEHVLMSFKRVIGRLLVLPVLMYWAFSALTVEQRRRVSRWVHGAVAAVAVAGLGTSGLQVIAGAGYPAGEQLSSFRGVRAVGFSDHPGVWGTFMILPFCLGLVALARRGGLGASAIIMSSWGGLLLAGSRSAVAAVGAVVLVYALVPFARRRLWQLGGVLVATMIVAGAVSPYMESALTGALRQWARVGIFGDGSVTSARDRGSPATTSRDDLVVSAELSLGDRWVTWKNLLGAWKTRPLLGIGLGNAEGHLATLSWQFRASERFNRDIVGKRISPHSTVLGVLVQTGLLGFAIFCCFIAFVVRCYWRAALDGDRVRRDLAIAYGLAFLGVLVSGLAQDLQDHLVFWWLIGMALVLGHLKFADDSSPAVR